METARGGPDLADLEAAVPQKQRDALSMGIRALIDADYVTAADAGSMGGPDWLDIVATEKGRRATGQWPPEDRYQSLVDVIEQMIDDEPDEAKKGKLRRLVAVIGDVGKDVGTAVLTAWVKSQTGLP